MKRRSILVAVVCLALLAGALATTSPITTHAAAKGPSWHVQPGPNPGAWNNTLNGVAALSSTDIWAVGSYSDSPSPYAPTAGFITHWDGTAWSIVPSPTPSTYSDMRAITALSSTNVWAVGDGDGAPLIEHWDGTTWSFAPGGTSYGFLYGIAAVSTNDIWAVGGSYSNTLIEHWDGLAWHVIEDAAVPGTLYGITAISSNDIWAVGPAQQSFYPGQTVTMHWDGAQWSVVPSPTLNGAPSLFSVTAVSSTDVWAVGQNEYARGHYNTLAEHWDGTQWSIVPAYSILYRPSYLIGTLALASNNVWAVGYDSCFSNCLDKTLIEHWNGTAWQLSNSPVMGVSVTLNSIVQIPGTGQLLTVGTYQSAVHVPYQTLVEMYY